MKSVEIWIGATLALGVVACGGEKPQPERGGHAPLSGSISKNVSDLVQGNFQDPCELKWNPIRQEIASALDARAAEIDAYAVQTATYPGWKTVDLGPRFKVREPSEPQKPRHGWRTYTASWAPLVERYRKIKDQPVNPDWVTLNASVKGILPDDRDRAIKGYNFYLDKDSGPFIKHIDEKLAQCRADTACSSPDFSPAAREFIRSQPHYARHLRKLEKAQGRQAALEVVDRFWKEVLGDYTLYEFVPNPAVRRASADRLVLPLNGDAFGEAKEQIGRYIKALWRKPGLDLQVEWVSGDLVSGIFRLVLEGGTGSRSFVLGRLKEVYLFQLVTSVEIAHEIGHVLGFWDHYYTVWDPDACGYEVQYNEEDLMSGSHIGTPTEDEWKELEEAYPFK